jgi:hypothetical protein
MLPEAGLSRAGVAAARTASDPAAAARALARRKGPCPGSARAGVAAMASTMRFPHGSFGAMTETRMSDDYERARAMIETARRNDALGRAMRASIEQRIAGGAEAAGHVHIEKGDTLWSFASRLLDAAGQGNAQKQ